VVQTKPTYRAKGQKTCSFVEKSETAFNHFWHHSEQHYGDTYGVIGKVIDSNADHSTY